MRIQEIQFTTCAKMTEEKSLNGDISSGGTAIINKKEFSTATDSSNGPLSPNLSQDNSSNDNSGTGGGGRLKFFKDGKFILELSHRKDGDRGGCWVPVPKKTTTFWPAVGTPRHESSTSLSVSDDNSSVQSSPWQRDHCWKQSSPRHHAGRGLEFYMVRPSKLRRLQYTNLMRRKRRRPLDARPVDFGDCKEALGNSSKKQPKDKDRSSIKRVVQALWERVIRADPVIVSPRKRILREMERVTLEDQAKRQRARPSPVTPMTNAHPTDSSSSSSPSPAASKAPSSHSITSILAREDGQVGEREPSFLRTLLRSPEPAPPSPSRQAVPFLSSTPIHHAPSMYAPHAHATAPSAFLPAGYYPPALAPAPHSAWYPVSSLPRGSSVYPGALLPPYAAALAAATAAANSSSTTSPWSAHHHHHHHHSVVPTHHHSVAADFNKRDDGASDVPLNLSKHAG